MAGIHMEGSTVPWFQMMQKAQQIPAWGALARVVEDHFGPTRYESARAQLFKLTQEGTLMSMCVHSYTWQTDQRRYRRVH